MWIDYTAKELKFKIGEWVLYFPTTIQFETFNRPGDYYGIDFHHDKYKFEVIESKLGTRLLINGNLGEGKDLPFNKSTAHFLPDFVSAKHISDFTLKH